jgi:O-methyltransferase
MSSSFGLDARLTAYVRSANRPEHLSQKRCRLETDAMGEVARMQISPEQGAFLQMCARLVQAKTAVEVGVFTGYSALSTILAMRDMHGPEARLYGCDISEDYTGHAQLCWQDAGVDGQIDLRLGDARETLTGLVEEIGGSVDMVFIDADKTGYDAYYEAALQLLRPGGLVLFDNVLWSGSVADPDRCAEDADTGALKALADKVRDDVRVDMAFTTIGDGVLMALKR